MDQEQQDKLRQPFPAAAVGQKPQPTCGQCNKSSQRVCDNHRKEKCRTCGQYMTNAHMHLDFVGHADLTDRMLKVDPEWGWEPMAYDADGLPKFDGDGGMWIKLTICGTTRPGYGHPDGKTGGNAVKETIGDALRNAGMRFGIALDLWRNDPNAETTPEGGESQTTATNQRGEAEEPQPNPERTSDVEELPAVDVKLLNHWKGWYEQANASEEPADRVDKLQKVYSKISQLDGLKGATSFFAAIEDAIHTARTEQANQPATKGTGQENQSGEDAGISDEEWEGLIDDAERNGNTEDLAGYVEALSAQPDKGADHRLTGIARAALNRNNAPQVA